ncbi:MAG: nucleoside deaminase [Chitinophagaceae bacterium]
MKETREERFMKMAIHLSKKGISEDKGGPFGAIIVRGNQILGRGFNQVASRNDPTAHAEIIAIRLACTKLNSIDLQDCEIFSSCEPCPMCFGAIYWAKMKCIYYGNSRNDAATLGFNDSFIYDQIRCFPEHRSIGMKQICYDQAHAVFQMWSIKANKVVY